MYYEKLSDLGIKLTRRAGNEQTQCPRCYDGRKNKNKKSLSVNITTGEFMCHNTPCEFKGNVRMQERREEKNYKRPKQDVIKNPLAEKAIKYLEKRGLSQQTIQKYFVFSSMEWMPQTSKEENCICFPYIDNDATIFNVKYRDGNKNFKLVTGARMGLFGIHLLGERKHIILVEGEIDCMTAYECGYGSVDLVTHVDKDTGEITEEPNTMRGKWCPASVPNGASGKSENQQKLEYLDTDFEILVAIEEFIIAVDDDEPGRGLKEELIRRLGVERCRFVEYPKQKVVPLDKNLKRACKDLNEVRLYIGVSAVQECVDNAKFLPIEGVYYLQDLYPRMLEKFRRGILLAPTSRMGYDMDAHFRWKKGDINLGVGYGNAGKTTFENQLELTKSIYDGWKWAVFCPENYPADDFYDDLVEPLIGESLQKMTEEQYEFACRFLQEHFFYVYPEDDHDLFSIHERFRHLIMKFGIDGVRIDPWNQLDKKFNQHGMSGEERLSVDLKAAKRFALLNGVCYNILAHPKNPTYQPDKSLPVVDMYDIAGGAQWGNKADNIWSLHRPLCNATNKNDPTNDIHFQKIKRERTGGKKGLVTMTFDWKTKRFTTSTGEQPCSMERAKIILAHEANNFSQMPLLPANVEEEDYF